MKSKKIILASMLACNVLWAESDILKVYDGVSTPVGMAFNHKNELIVAEWSASRVSVFGKDGRKRVLSDHIKSPSGIAVDKDDNVYVASYSTDTLYKIEPNGNVSIIADELATPAGVSIDQNGNIMVASKASNAIIFIDQKGTKSNLFKDLQTPVGIVELEHGYAISNINGDVSLYDKEKRKTGSYKGFKSPAVGIVGSQDGNVYAVDYGGSDVVEIQKNGNARVLTSSLSSPVGVAINPQGELFIGTWGDSAIYKLTIK